VSPKATRKNPGEPARGMCEVCRLQRLAPWFGRLKWLRPIVLPLAARVELVQPPPVQLGRPNQKWGGHNFGPRCQSRPPGAPRLLDSTTLCLAHLISLCHSKLLFPLPFSLPDLSSLESPLVLNNSGLEFCSRPTLVAKLARASIQFCKC